MNRVLRDFIFTSSEPDPPTGNSRHEAFIVIDKINV